MSGQFAGVERVAAAGSLTPAWTSAKGAYAEPVAEHALMLALAGLRLLRKRIMARSWGPRPGSALRPAGHDPGGGGIAARLLELLAPLRVTATVVRRGPTRSLAPPARWVCPSCVRHSPAPRSCSWPWRSRPAPDHIIGAAELAAMRPDAWLVNVARGPHVDTDALVAALSEGAIGGAALDVTDPEPLPDGHPLWELERCIVARTPPTRRR